MWSGRAMPPPEGYRAGAYFARKGVESSEGSAPASRRAESGSTSLGQVADCSLGGHLPAQIRVGLLELVVLDLQDLDDPGQELRLATQIVAFGPDAGQVLLLLVRAGSRRRGITTLNCIRSTTSPGWSPQGPASDPGSGRV
jgi:hypothetical protein